MTNDLQAPCHVALLRGINVGGHNKLPMAALKAMFEATGCDHVRTYIQSGNVVFRATDAMVSRIPEAIQTAIHARFGYTVPVITRPADALAQIVANNPYAHLETDDRFVHVGFLAETPAPDLVAGLDAERFAPDTFTVSGSEIYLHYPNGAARSKMTNAYFDRQLSTISTMRNGRTTKKLLSMTQD